MRSFDDGDEITIEPWRADRVPGASRTCASTARAFDRIIAAGGYISVNTGAAPDAHAMPVPKDKADRAFDAATCIGCGACVAACPNGSASLFLGAKITHLGELPQGQAERDRRVVHMVGQHDAEGFGGCTNIGECTAACPKEIPLDVISRLNWDLHAAAAARALDSPGASQRTRRAGCAEPLSCEHRFDPACRWRSRAQAHRSVRRPLAPVKRSSPMPSWRRSPGPAEGSHHLRRRTAGCCDPTGIAHAATSELGTSPPLP